MAKQSRLIALLALFASFFALCVIGLGAFTRLVDAGLGCPDWPGCYGHLTVPSVESAALYYPGLTLDAFKAWAEMIHRYFAGCLGLLILGILFFVFKKNLRKSSNIILAIALFLLLLYQILLGQWTVTFKLMPIVVTQHLLGGFLILSTLWILYLNNRTVRFEQGIYINPLVIFGAMLGLLILFVQIILGAWTSTNYAALSCPDFPFCVNTGMFFPMHFKEAFNVHLSTAMNYEGGVLSQNIRQTIQMTHRLVALIFTLYMLFYTIFSVNKLKMQPDLLKSIYLVWVMIFIQISLGIINLIYQLPLITAVGHNLGAILLLMAMITFIFNLFQAKQKELQA